MKRSLTLLLSIAGAVLALDIWTKRWADATLAYRPPVNVLGEFVRLTYTRNSGVAFGLGAGVRFPYYLFSIVATLIILYMFLRRHVDSAARQVALALILGGALGNLVDRVRSGEVVDFIEVGWARWHWPVFNVADSAVTIGVLLFALTWRQPDHERLPNSIPIDSIDAGEASGHVVQLDDPDAGSLGPGAQHRGAARPIPGDGTDGPLP